MKKSFKYLGFRDMRYALIGIPLLCFFVPQIFFQTYPTDGWKPFLTKSLVTFVFSIVLWPLIRIVMITLRKRYPKIDSVGKRVWIMIGLTFIIVPLVNVVLDPIIYGLCYNIKLINANPSFYQSVLSTSFICLSIVAVYEAAYSYYQLEISVTEKEAAKRAQVRSELESLRNQVNPHFLFNSLNTLMNIINEDQELAQRFLKRMSKVYRYVLESRELPLIPLKEELEFIEAFVFLQEERFKGNLKVDIQIDESFYQYRAIPLCLQILFENAIKHNVISRQKNLQIKVFINDEMELVVSNNLQRKQQVIDSTHVGLENISKRYQYFTKREIKIIEQSGSFAVHIPLIHPNESLSYESADY